MNQTVDRGTQISKCCVYVQQYILVYYLHRDGAYPYKVYELSRQAKRTVRLFGHRPFYHHQNICHFIPV